MMSDAEKENAASTSPEEDEKASKGSSEATAPQASPRKVCGSEFHHHVVPTDKSGAINVYVQVNAN